MSLPVRDMVTTPSRSDPASLETPRPRPTAAAAPASQPADLLIRTSHADIAVRQSAGRKMPTLLIHGNSSSKEIFNQQFASALGQEYRLIAIDLPGHGNSSDAFDPHRSYSMVGYADAVVEVLEHLGIDEVAVIGWSLGGHIGMEMMALYPLLTGLMIIGAPPVGSSPDAIRQGFRDHPDLLLAGKQEFTDADVEAFARTTSGGSSDPVLRTVVRRADGRARRLMVEGLLSGQASDQRQLVETMDSIPLAVVNGAEEPFVDTAYLSTLSYANLWRGACHVIPRTGHAPFLEAPQIFNDILSRFLADMAAHAAAKAENPPLTYSA
jgi:pimeloyl-ACP methyl ester carboxylesterase